MCVRGKWAGQAGHVPFILPDLINLHNGYYQIGSKDTRNDHSIHNLVPLLVQASIHHHKQVLLPLSYELCTLLLEFLAELNAGSESQAIWLVPEEFLLLQAHAAC